MCGFFTFCGNECSLALFAGSSLIHSFDVEQVILTGLQENPLFTAFDAWDGSRSMSHTHIYINKLLLSQKYEGILVWDYVPGAISNVFETHLSPSPSSSYWRQYSKV